MRTIAIDTEYDYCDPFLATVTDEDMYTRAFHTKVLSQKKELKRICEDRNIRKVFHHASGDMFILRNIGIYVVPPYECTLIASNLVDENYSSRNLKVLATKHLGIVTHESNRLKSTITKYKKIAAKGGYPFKWSQIPEDVMLPYAKRDPEYTLQLWYYWQTPIQEMRKLYEFEKSIIPLIVDMEWKGLRIDRYLCGRKSREYGQRLDVLYEEMGKCIVDNHIDLGKEFNPRSPQQIQKLILAMGVEDEGNKNPKTGMPITDKKSLQKLALNNSFFSLLQQSRFFNKHKGTYYDPLKDYYTSEENEIAHFMMYQTGAKTGRFSVELAQTFPKPEDSVVAGQKHEVRKVIIPRRGKAFLCIDYEQQEMRLFCHYANCERMIEIINQKSGTKGFDIYIETADLLFGKIFENPKYRKALRWVAKQDALGGIYSIGMNKLIAQTTVHLHEKFGREIVEEIGVSDRWAYDSLQKFYKMYPVREYTQANISELNMKGYIELEFHSRLMDFHRRYHIPQDKAYKGGNARIQGCLYGGSRVYTQEHGYVTLKEIVDQEVTIWDGDRFVKAQCLASGKKQKVVVQFFNGQQIICSPGHKFLRISANVEWCQAKNLNKNYRIIVGNSIPENIYNIRSGLQHDFNKYDKESWSSWSSNKINFMKISDFDFGVVLGRLISDGTISRDCEWIIAEHEYEILEYLKNNLELMGKVLVRDLGVRENRNQGIVHLVLSSARLGVLFKSLKKEIPSWLFKNTEILRGYLRGMFDGDGSVNTQGTIILVQGGDISWTFMRRLQEALLLFGIRSRLRFYEYGYRVFHLQISVKDNKIFADRIGFINQIKQNKIRFTKVDYGESVYNTEKVKSVNITKEYIDMYDIVNSESGKYMANGLVTHNTAAYIIKHAMLRVKNRIEQEGWQNHVEMILQVHDELIFEVDNDLPFIRYVKDVLCDEMNDMDTFRVPITTSAKWSPISLGDVTEEGLV